MNPLIAASLKFENGQLLILDQYLLPHEEVWHQCNSVDDLIDLIRALKVRGAPLIGISAAVLVAKLALDGHDKSFLANAIKALRAARPTAVNLMNCMDEMQKALAEENVVEALTDCATWLFEHDVAMCEAMAKQGAALIKANDHILTHCNTGALATAGIGTALGVIYQAHKEHKNIHVWVDETRPLLQGGRLTAYELSRWQIPYKLICDNMAASLMAAGDVDKILVGADRIATNGDFANKVGTYNLAVLAHYHRIPFYVVAPKTTVDIHCQNGSDIPIEQRSSREVTGVSGSFGSCQWAPDDAQVINPAFDVTPAHLVSGWILDTGVYHLHDIEQGVLHHL